MLSIKDLTVSYNGVTVLDRVSLELPAGGTLAVIGESGAGKSTLGLTAAGLIEGEVQGQVLWRGRDLYALSAQERRSVHWNDIAVVFQRGGEVLHPGLTMEWQVAEPMTEHRLCDHSEALARARHLLVEVGLPTAKHGCYPHTLSGGEKQRGLIAMAMANDPLLIVLDEPTAGLDALTRTAILTLLEKMSGRCSFLMLTHDLAAASCLAGRTAVLYGGQLLEEGPSGSVLRVPRHPYTRGLLRAYPNMTTTKDLQGIPGRAHVHTHAHIHGTDERDHPHNHVVKDQQVSASQLPRVDHAHAKHVEGAYHVHAHAHDLPARDHDSGGCPFHGRCTQAIEVCFTTRPNMAEREGELKLACHRGGIIPLLQVQGVTKSYGAVRALDQVSLYLDEGETLAVVGESGSGKTTLANVIIGLASADTGEVYLEQELVTRRDKSFYKRVQIVFQDPVASVSHRYNVLRAVAEPLVLQYGGKPEEHVDRVRSVLEEVQLPSDDTFLSKYPHHMSGGEAQRVAIARALALSPKLLIADEPTSALDPSIQAKIMRLLLDIQEERGLSILLITHDLALARKVSDRMVVMRGGQVIEDGLSEQVTVSPQNPYTRELLSAAPVLV